MDQVPSSRMNCYCLQLDIAWEDKPANHAKVESLLDQARPKPGSLVLLPEMFSTGFSMNVATVTDSATRSDERFCSALAAQWQITLAAGLVHDQGGRGLNQCVVYSPDGREIARYSKLHLFSPGKEAQHYTPGRDITLYTWNGLTVCPFICYDLRFPEIFRLATARGAQMFTVIANWPSARIEHWLTLLRARAIENQAFVAAVNRCGNDPWLAYSGRSQIIDPTGQILADAGVGQAVISATIDPAAVAAWRAEFPVLADRRDIQD